MMFFNPLPPLPFVSPALGSHMVLQRDHVNTFWGWAPAGTPVTVTIADKSAKGVAGADGKWTVRLTPPKVGGPYTVKIDGTEHVELQDVLVGDVWLCTGQSNMEFGIAGEYGAQDEVAAANDPNLRLFMVPRQGPLTPAKVNGGEWKICTPTTVAENGWNGFSAVGYHFGKALRREVGVPVGLIEDCVGGTDAEQWTSSEALKAAKGFDGALKTLDSALHFVPVPDKGESLGWHTAEFDASSWKTVPYMSTFHALGLDSWSGIVWVRKDITLTEAQAAGDASLSLGMIDDNDVTYVNGKRVGAIEGYNVQRVYPVPAGTLKAGHNVVAIQIINTGGFGGGYGSSDALNLSLGDGSKVSLDGDWQAKAGVPILAIGSQIPTTLFNGMIAPEIRLGIKGAIWYQGENNAGRAAQYQHLLSTMIGDWRHRFGQGNFPFYIVSLASYQARQANPVFDDWAALREAQAATATKVPNTGLAVTIDIGDAVDIHPKEKKTVGERLALIALAKTYGKSVPYSGPTYRSLTVEGAKAIVKFDYVDGGLVVKGEKLGEFSVAGEDHVWHWATARIEGNTVVVTSSEVSKPIAVRYAWQSNPLATLFNGSGLPAVPFRTDNWPRSGH